VSWLVYDRRELSRHPWMKVHNMVDCLDRVKPTILILIIRPSSSQQQ
jgi:hypothetical protein